MDHGEAEWTQLVKSSSDVNFSRFHFSKDFVGEEKGDDDWILHSGKLREDTWEQADNC